MPFKTFQDAANDHSTINSARKYHKKARKIQAEINEVMADATLPEADKRASVDRLLRELERIGQ